MSTLKMRIGENLRRHPYIRRSVVVGGGVVLGVFLLMIFILNRQEPTRHETVVTPTNVRIIEAKALPFSLEARGNGVARPAESWQAVANVAGRVVERHPDLESGAFLSAGSFLLGLDPSRYELAVTEARSELATLEAERSQLGTEEAHIERLLELERERLALAEGELTRLNNLAERGAVSRSQLDEQHRATLAQRQAVASLESSLSIFPSQLELLAARHARAETHLAQTQRDLEDTQFFAPYDLRLESVQVELHQFASVGQILFQADNINAAEVEAHIPVSMMRRLVGGLSPADPTVEATLRQGPTDFSAIVAEVEMVGMPGALWTGYVTGIASGLDPITRTVRVIVRVKEPYRDARPPERPPLQRGVYTRVRLLVRSPQALLVVPASAVHAGSVFLVNDNDLLERRSVEVAFEQADLAVIGAGLQVGERVVVDDLSWAVPGLPLATLRDEKLESWMARRANGGLP